MVVNGLEKAVKSPTGDMYFLKQIAEIGLKGDDSSSNLNVAYVAGTEIIEGKKAILYCDHSKESKDGLIGKCEPLLIEDISSYRTAQWIG